MTDTQFEYKGRKVENTQSEKLRDAVKRLLQELEYDGHGEPSPDPDCWVCRAMQKVKQRNRRRGGQMKTRFLITNREGIELAERCSGLAEAIKTARSVKISNDMTGPSDVYVIDATGLVQPINIP